MCHKEMGSGDCLGDDGITDAERPAWEKSKMYILVKGEVDLGHAALACAHAALGGYLHFVESESPKGFDKGGVCGSCGHRDLPTGTEKWASLSFRKVICSVTDEQFEKAKTYGVAGKDYRVMTESGLGGIEVAIVFRPRNDFEPFFKSLPLFGKDRG
jgi:peptidyl-tRNA hydrolase